MLRGEGSIDVSQIVERINELFNVTNKEIYASESGVTYHADKEVKKIGYCVNLTLTGECNLYTIQYAQFKGINLIIGSRHTFTEFFGIQSLAIKLNDKKELEVVRLNEEHYEANIRIKLKETSI